MRTLPIAVRIYVAVVLAAAGWAAFVLRDPAGVERPALLLAILGLGCLAARLHLEVPFPSLGGGVTVGYGGTLAAFLMLGTPSALFVAVVSTILLSLISRPRPTWYRTVYSVALVTLSVAAAGAVYTRLGGSPGLDLSRMAGPLVGAATTYLLTYVVLSVPGNAMTSRQGLLRGLDDALLATAPSYFAGAFVSAVFVGGRPSWLTVVSCVPFYLVVHANRAYCERQREHEQHVEQLGSLHLATTEALARAIDAKDQTSHGHIRRVQVYARGLARALKMSSTEVRGVETAAMLHDVGKIGVPDYILSKPGPLTRDEFRRVRRHPEIGADIIAAVPFPYPVAPYIRSHHERWDGSGYPDGMEGAAIPLGARILSVVDYFDALVSDRPYHSAMSEAEAVATLAGEAGRALDPTVVAKFLAIRPELDAELSQAPPASTAPISFGEAALGRPATGFAISSKDSVFWDIASIHREAGAMYEMAHGLGASLSIDGTMDLIESKVHQLVPLSACALFLWDKDDTETLLCRAARGVDAGYLKRLALHGAEGVNGWVARHKKPVANALARWDLQMLPGDLSSVRLKSAAAWPLIVNDAVIGTLALYHVDEKFYTEELCLPLERARQQIAAVVHNALLFEQTQAASLTDALTDLPNARQLQRFVIDELARAERQNLQMALMIFDIDNFKHVNDRYGHDAGNRALCTVARALQDSVRVGDLCARYAGDEFVVVLVGCDIETAETKRTQIRRAIEQQPFEARQGVVGRLKVSSGVAVFPVDATTYDGLLAAADGRMYGDKADRQSAATA
jgi:diguanylate cyclase (GGDEF)-like protein